MLTKQQDDEASLVASGIISLNSALDLPSIHSHDNDAQLRGTLILAGEEDMEEDDAVTVDREVFSSRLSLPESGLLPSELTLKKEVAFVEDNENDGLAAKCTNEADNIISSSHPSTLLAVVTLLFVSTAIAVLFGYIHNLQQTVASLESQLQQQAVKSNIDPNDDIFNHSNNNTYIYENCYFKAALTPGSCSQDVQSWFFKYIKVLYPSSSDSCTPRNNGDYEEEEVFLYQLLDTFKYITYQSYSHVEDALRNVTFDSSSLLDSLTGLHQHYDSDSSNNNTTLSFTDIANTVLDEGSALVKLIERRAGEAASTVVDSTTVWLRDVFELVSEEDLVAWN